MSQFKSTRRRFLQAGAAAGAFGMIGRPAIAKTWNVKFTLAWLAQGTSLFPYVGKQKGFFAKRGIDLDISRGFGSLAAAQSIASGQFDYGIVISAPLVLMVAKGLPLKGLATVDYDAMMGVGVLADSPIRTPADLVGKKIATVPASAESPFFAAYAKLAKFDASTAQMVNVDAKVIERTLESGQTDAMTGIASSSLPVLLSSGKPARWMLYSSAGIPTYGNAIVGSTKSVESDPELSAALVDALFESLAFTIANPEEAADLFFKAVPEAGLTAGAREFVRIGMGLHRVGIAKPEAIKNGLGYGDPKVYDAITDLVMSYLGTPDMKRPAVDDWYSNKFAGNIKLAPEQWSKIDGGLGEFRKLLS